MTKHLVSRVSQLWQSHEYWNSVDAIILKPGEIGVDSDLHIYKVGDGIHKWNEITEYHTFLNEDGTSVLNGGLNDYSGEDNPVTIVLATEESPRYSNQYIPKKGEPITELTSTDLQGMKIGDGRRSFNNLKYVTPYDDVVIEDYDEVEDFNL